MLRWLALVLTLQTACGRRGFDSIDGRVGDGARPPGDTSTDTVLIDARECSVPPANCQTPQMYTCNGQCFAVCGQITSRAAAAMMCTNWGGCLATIKSVDDNTCTAQMLTGRVAWIGATQAATATATDSDWTWCDGSALSFISWGTNEPDDINGTESGQENCSAIDGTAAWRDDPCGNTHELICSRPM